MEIKHQNFETKGRFFIEYQSKVLAEMTYSNAGKDRIIIDHTEVNESLQGRGVGYKLVGEAVAHARKNNLKIIPLCPFANAVFKKKSEFKDVLQ
ncbi:GNAT family N-acetyltransferase [Winogradskyella litorisediminis]|uniref:GNAT family N-acetyltransferase n=1 Tax=Winogradskyella litorisediminis TaxID=1156618 RepID=A0ABW3N1W9_9FLAO